MLSSRDKRKFRREFRGKGYEAVYHEVSGYPPGKRELAHVWLRERERASDPRERWMIALIVIVVATAMAMLAYIAVLRWL
jgi:hypothetical protein